MPRAQKLYNWLPCGLVTKSEHDPFSYRDISRVSVICNENTFQIAVRYLLKMNNQRCSKRNVHLLYMCHMFNSITEGLQIDLFHAVQFLNACTIFKGCKPKHLFASIFYISASLMCMLPRTVYEIFTMEKKAKAITVRNGPWERTWHS